MSAISQFERDCIATRTQEGLKAARARGRLGGRPKANQTDIQKAIKLYNTKEYTLKEIQDLTGVTKATLYRYLRTL